MALDVAINSCKGLARRFLGSLPLQPDSMEEFWCVMGNRFGTSKTNRIFEWRTMRQKEGESVRSFADRLQEQSYDLGLPIQIILAQFVEGLKEKTLIRTHLAT